MAQLRGLFLFPPAFRSVPRGEVPATRRPAAPGALCGGEPIGRGERRALRGSRLRWREYQRRAQGKVEGRGKTFDVLCDFFDVVWQSRRLGGQKGEW